MVSRDIAYEVGGATMVGRLALPDGEGLRPAVLIAHEGNGLDELQKGRAERFAELGYVAFALDYYGGGAPLQRREEINARLAELYDDPDRALALAGAGLDVLRAEPRADPAKVAVVGYCFGGTLALELARSGSELAAVVGFHPGLEPLRPTRSANIVAKVLACVGADDPLIPPEHRAAFEAEMRAVVPTGG